MKVKNNGLGFTPSELYLRTSAVRRAHSIAITASFEKPIDLEVAKQAIHDFPNVELVDNPEQSEYPMPINYSEVVPCAVGRMRKTDIVPNGLSFWVTGDQL